MTSLSAKDICFSIGTRDILHGISFSIEVGDRLAVVGVNGAGKSTLLKIIAGEYDSTSGEIFTAGGTVIGFMKQDMDFNIIVPLAEKYEKMQWQNSELEKVKNYILTLL